jgi:hypothetical protein
VTRLWIGNTTYKKKRERKRKLSQWGIEQQVCIIFPVVSWSTEASHMFISHSFILWFNDRHSDIRFFPLAISYISRWNFILQSCKYEHRSLERKKLTFWISMIPSFLLIWIRLCQPKLIGWMCPSKVLNRHLRANMSDSTNNTKSW